MTDYPAALREAWAAHLAPREPDAPTVVSLFSGCGGSSLGYSMAGYRELGAVEWEDNAARVFAANFPGVRLFHGDIAALDPGWLDLPAGELDVLDGSPPCQGFSLSGKRDTADPRNQLAREFIRLLAAWAPRAFVMENVAGMVSGDMRLLFARILTGLKGCGYRVVVRLVDAAQLSVPQSRKRLIFTGIREDLPGQPAHPAPSGRPVSVRAAWAAGLDDPGEAWPICASRAGIAPLMTPGESAAVALRRLGGRGSFQFTFARLRWDAPARTIVGNSGSAWLHPDDNRMITTRELTRLQSFPDEFTWPGCSPLQIQRLAGNTVPPLMMRAVAQTVRERMLPGRVSA